jgi:hypothetical protein
MTITVPVSVNYQSPLIFVPTRWQNESPVEGSGMISCEIDWGVMGGTENCVSINPQANTANPNSISQIVALAIDNSDCGADIQFLFPDTSYTLTIPAYTPACVFPVFTNGTFFYVQSPNAESEDVTRFQILNTLPPPAVIPQSLEQETETFNDVPFDGATSQVLLADTVNGTVQGVQVYCTVDDASGNVSDQVKVVDGTGKLICGSQVSVANTGAVNAFIINMNPCRIRFQQGLTFEQSGGDPGGHFSITILYQTP